MQDLVILFQAPIILFALLFFYLIGSINTARVLVFLTRNKTILETGTGNAGANNVWRVFSKKYGKTTGVIAGISVMFVDIGKGVLIVYLARDSFGFPAVLALACGIIGMIGHNWPFFRVMRGGKGIALFGGVLWMLHPVSAAVTLFVVLGLPMTKRLSGVVPFVAIPVYILVNLIYEQAGIRNLDLGVMNPETIGVLFASLALIYSRRIDAEWLILEKQPSKVKAFWYLFIYDRATNDPPPLFGKQQ